MTGLRRQAIIPIHADIHFPFLPFLLPPVYGISCVVQTSCSEDLDRATSFFGGDTSPPQEKVDEYTSNPANAVSDS